MIELRKVRAACAAVLLAVFAGTFGVAPAQAAAKPRPISGNLNKRGYTVIAIATTGKVVSVAVAKGKFRLRPPASKVTLHLRAPGGTYAGPVVVGRKGKFAVLGVKAGARLGNVKIHKGFATLGKRLAARSIVSAFLARAKSNVPIGAAKTGLVRSRSTSGGTATGDNDLDGVPNALDIDDDGDLILDDYDMSSYTQKKKKKTATESASEATFPGGSRMTAFTMLPTFNLNPVNHDGGSSDAEMAATQRNFGVLNLAWGWTDAGTEELNCGTLVYCTRNGTGLWEKSYAPGQRDSSDPSFPECCDLDNDGFGSLTPSELGQQTPTGTATTKSMQLLHGATADQIRAGDVLIETAKLNGGQVQSVTSIGFVFASNPMLRSYDDGQGNSRNFTYPRTDMCPVGTMPLLCPVPVRAGPSGDVLAKLTFWRPQRPRTAGDPGADKWMDVGNLGYATSLTMSSGGGASCAQDSFTEMDPKLVADPTSNEPFGPPTGLRYLDQSGDQPASPANTFSYTLNLSRCLAASGLTMSTTQATTAYLNAYALRESPWGFGPRHIVESQATTSIAFILQ